LAALLLSPFFPRAHYAELIRPEAGMQGKFVIRL
jgi:hypothetical protein